MKCTYCELPSNLVECSTCNKFFCNSRSSSSISHIIFHLVKTKHKSIIINNEDILCTKCNEDNIFKLVKYDNIIYCKECSTTHTTIEERCLTILPSNTTNIQLSKSQMIEIEEKSSYLLPSVKSRLDPLEYVNIFTTLIDAECQKEREIKEQMRQENVVIRWETMKYGYFYFYRSNTDLKINIGDEIKLTHKSGLCLTGYINNDNFSEELRFEVDQSGDYPRSGYIIEYIWRGVCYERMKWALNKLYNQYLRQQNYKVFKDENVFKDDNDKVCKNENDKVCKNDNVVVNDNINNTSNTNTTNTSNTNTYNQLSSNSNSEDINLFEYLVRGGKENIKLNLEIDNPPNLPILNKYQELAVKAALSRKVTLIQGPPGTGKTLVSAAIVYNYIKKNKGPVLVVAPSNTAVDQLTLKIHKTGLKIIRVMSRRREYTQSDVNFLSLHENVREYLSNLDDILLDKYSVDKSNLDKSNTTKTNLVDKSNTTNLVDNAKRKLLMKADVISCTCVTAGQKMFNKMKFTCVLVDEAVQSTEPLNLIPLVYGCKKLILVGDHKQLGPTILSKKVAQAGFKQSMFERLISIGVSPYILNLQYRMHPDLCEWPSETFYNGELLSGNRLTYKYNINIPHNFFYACFGKEEVSASGTSFINPMEALYCESIIRHLFKSGITENQIGVITPYEGQRSHILNRVFGSEPGNLEISNVDGFQGREKDFIIVSLVRSNQYQGIGFVGDKRRMNVTLTRAKHGLIIIGNPNTMMKHEIWKNLLEYYDKKGLILEGPLGDLRRYAIL
ncbi:regulator of nonsense transcripts protein [Vairimorpha necatrix]|uniref:Regulator of nonsense transcripts protein n=1 Tax=Vairimorpha necatrix TaxID=6039 RepID=A0AAX4JEY9_9MICR